MSLRIAELLANEPIRQEEFPVARAKVFLAHAGVCPLPRRVADAVARYAAFSTQGDQETLWPAYRIRDTRQLAGRLLLVEPEEIALVAPTSMGLSLVAAGIDWQFGDNMAAYFDDYPANVYPWMSLRERGVEIRFLKPARLGEINLETVRRAVDSRTRLVAIASCHFVSGFRVNLPEMSGYLRAKKIWFCLDAIQTLGAFPLDARLVDFAAADAHKWLLGPCGAGIFYVRRELQDRLRPAVLGWHNVRCPNYVAQERLVLRPDARRYEAGTQNLLGLAGLHAALELLLEVGVENIATELLRKRAWVLPELQKKGFTVLNPQSDLENASAIISFFRAHTNMAGLGERLENSGIVASLRVDRAGQQYLRISPHFYNTDAELEKLLDAL